MPKPKKPAKKLKKKELASHITSLRGDMFATLKVLGKKVQKLESKVAMLEAANGAVNLE
jgi:hypothetical protein